MASVEDSALIWTRPEPGTRRPKFTRDQIASTALAIADTEGFAAHWYDALTAVALRTWDVLMRHPWALQSLQNAPAGPNAMRHFEQSLAAVTDTGLAAPGKFALLAMVDDYVHGNVLRAAELRTASNATMDEAAIRFGQAQLATGQFPHTQALFGDDDPREVFPRLLGDTSERDRFRNGLTVLLDGVASRMKLGLPDR